MSKYNIDVQDLGVDFADDGAWRSYGMSTSGDSLQELLSEAVIYETGQDGGELNSYSLDNGNSQLERAALVAIEDYLLSYRDVQRIQS